MSVATQQATRLQPRFRNREKALSSAMALRDSPKHLQSRHLREVKAFLTAVSCVPKDTFQYPANSASRPQFSKQELTVVYLDIGGVLLYPSKQFHLWSTSNSRSEKCYTSCGLSTQVSNLAVPCSPGCSALPSFLHKLRTYP